MNVNKFMWINEEIWIIEWMNECKEIYVIKTINECESMNFTECEWMNE